MTKPFTRPGRVGHSLYQLCRYALAALLLCAGTAARAQYAYHSQFGSQGTGNNQFSTPRGIAVDYDGYVYVSDQNNHRVQRFRADGTYNMTIGGLGTTNGKFNQPTSIAVDQLGFLYVVDSYNDRIQRFTPTGLWNLTVNGTDAGGVVRFEGSIDVDVDKDGNIYVLDYYGRVVKYNVNGEWVKTVALKYTTGYQYSCLAVDAEGNFYVSEYRYSGVAKYSSQGVLLGSLPEISLSMGELDHVQDMTFDKTGNLLVLDSYNSLRSTAAFDMYVLKFNANQHFITGFGASGAGNGQFETPTGIALDPDGNVLVADMGNYRVQKFTALPEVEVKASATVIADNTGSYDFGSTTVGTSAVARTFTISNATGAKPLAVSNLTLPAGFGLTGNFPATIAPGGTADFTVALSPAALGTFSGTLSFSTNDPDENPYNFTISGAVKQPQAITFDSIPDKFFDAQGFAMDATASSGLPVTYAVVSGPASVTGTNVNWWGTGLVTVQASQAGNAQYSAAAPV
ncbi:MAG TPA: choice-of-anchor D domain-containing protein, partial [Cytophagales bacterium]